MLNKIKEASMITSLEYLTEVNIRKQMPTRAQYRISPMNIAAIFMFYPSSPCTVEKIITKLEHSEIEDKDYIIGVLNISITSTWRIKAKKYLRTLSDSFENDDNNSSQTEPEKKKRCFDFDSSLRPTSSKSKKIASSLNDEFQQYENMPVEHFEDCKIIIL